MANIGHGATLSGASTGSIGNMDNIQLSGPTVDTVDVTTMASTNKWREYIAGLKDAGSISGELIYEKANYNTVHSAIGGTAEVWTLTFPDGSTLAGSGFLTSNGSALPLDDKVTQSIEIKLTGEPTFTPAA